ncbi:MAG: hypothetical protein EXS09_19155 [Gemmataceae bacterium]|nr:hypothetical protein [Gemmataceae bacterium]
MRFHTFAGAMAIVSGLLFSAPIQAEDHVGPHKGAVVEWGDEEYHLEIVPDMKAGTVVVYVYGNHSEFHKAKVKPIDSKALVLTVKGEKSIAIKLDPKPAKGDASGMSSMFVGKHELFSKEGKLTGSISGKVGTKPYTGDFKQK